MKKEIIKEIANFIRERITESFFPEEKAVLRKGLKLMNLSLEKLLEMQLKGYDEKELESGTFPEVDILNLPNSPLAKVIGKMPKSDEKAMEDFAAVQLTLYFIIFEYFRRNDGKEVALDFGKSLVKTFNKIKSRIGEETPTYINAFLTNMNREVGYLEEELKNAQLGNITITITQEELKRYQEAYHYLIFTQTQKQISSPVIQKTVHKIHFENYSGEQFERLMFAYVLRSKNWDSTPQWLGQAGSDSGRDIWAVFNKETYCYACANWKGLNFAKAKSDIDKLKKNKFIPVHLVVVSGGVVSANLRAKIIAYGKKAGAKTTEVWAGVEVEEKLRFETPELIRRFVEGELFPDSPGELIKLNNIISTSSDEQIIELLSECFDRPAFTTPFYNESSIPEFEMAISRTIEVLNTGVHRLNDGTLIRTIASRHKVTDEKLKSELAFIVQLVIKLRDIFTELKRKKEIKPCECGQGDCSTYMLTENACKIMDDSRTVILKSFRKVKPNFSIRLN